MILYTTPGCPKCHDVRLYLQNQSMEYTEVNLLQDPKAAQQMEQELGEVYAPVLWKNEQFIDGETYLYSIIS